VFSRSISFLIIGFWLIMTGLLLRAIWFPGDSQLDRISPGAIFRVIAARGDSSHLDIYEGRQIVGKLNVTPMPMSDPGQVIGRVGLTKLHVDGTLDLRLQALKLTATGDILLGHEGELAGIDLRLQIKSQKLELTIRQDGPGIEPSLKLTMAGIPLLDTSGNLSEGSELEANPAAALLLSLAGLSPEDLRSVQLKAEMESAATKVDARQGEFELNEVKHRGYVISVLRHGTPSFRMCVENTGQILSIDTPTSYRLVADDLSERGIPSGG
jgi:hypothetical protein